MESSSEGRNLVGLFVGDEKLASQVRTDLSSSLKHLDSITSRVERGEGALGQALDANSDLSRAVADLGAAAKNFRAFSDQLDAAKGSVLGRLLFDPERGKVVVQDIEATVHHLRSISEKIDQGQGSAALMINDKRMYEGVSDVVRGIEKSWFVSFILKRKGKKGFEDRVDKILRESPNPDADLIQLLRDTLREGQPGQPGP